MYLDAALFALWCSTRPSSMIHPDVKKVSARKQFFWSGWLRLNFTGPPALNLLEQLGFAGSDSCYILWSCFNSWQDKAGGMWWFRDWMTEFSQLGLGKKKNTESILQRKKIITIWSWPYRFAAKFLGKSILTRVKKCSASWYYGF